MRYLIILFFIFNCLTSFVYAEEWITKKKPKDVNQEQKIVTNLTKDYKPDFNKGQHFQAKNGVG